MKEKFYGVTIVYLYLSIQYKQFENKNRNETHMMFKLKYYSWS